MQKSLNVFTLSLAGLLVAFVILGTGSGQGQTLRNYSGSQGTSLTNDLSVPSTELTPVPTLVTTVESLLQPLDPSLGPGQTRAQGAQAIIGPVTEVSIQNYIAANPSVGGIVASNHKITDIRFMTISELNSLLKAEQGQEDPFLGNFAPDERVAYVTLSGQFIFESDPAAEGSTATTAVRDSLYRVFSLTTGNELMGGTLSPKPGK